MILYPLCVCECVFHRSRRYYKFPWPEAACSSPDIRPGLQPVQTSTFIPVGCIGRCLSELVRPPTCSRDHVSWTWRKERPKSTETEHRWYSLKIHIGTEPPHLPSSSQNAPSEIASESPVYPAGLPLGYTSARRSACKWNRDTTTSSSNNRSLVDF